MAYGSYTRKAWRALAVHVADKSQLERCHPKRERISFQASISRGKLLVSGRVIFVSPNFMACQTSESYFQKTNFCQTPNYITPKNFGLPMIFLKEHFSQSFFQFHFLPNFKHAGPGSSGSVSKTALLAEHVTGGRVGEVSAYLGLTFMKSHEDVSFFLAKKMVDKFQLSDKFHPRRSFRKCELVLLVLSSDVFFSRQNGFA